MYCWVFGFLLGGVYFKALLVRTWGAGPSRLSSCLCPALLSGSSSCIAAPWCQAHGTPTCSLPPGIEEGCWVQNPMLSPAWSHWSGKGQLWPRLWGCPIVDPFAQLGIRSCHGSALICHMFNLRCDAHKLWRCYTLFEEYVCGLLAVLSHHKLALALACRRITIYAAVNSLITS